MQLNEPHWQQNMVHVYDDNDSSLFSSPETLGNHKIDSNHNVSSKVFIQVPSDVINNNCLFQLATFLNKPVAFLTVTLSFQKSNCRLKTPGIFFVTGDLR